jgi:hypothetical protein
VHQLIVGLDLPRARAVGERALRAAERGVGERRADVLEAEAVVRERVRIHVDADGGSELAADEHLTDALDARELLLQERRGAS